MVEVRDASGDIVATNHAEVITFAGWIVPVAFLGVIAGTILVGAGLPMAVAWLRILLVAIGMLMALTGVASIVFFIWGRYFGFPWHFTP